MNPFFNFANNNPKEEDINYFDDEVIFPQKGSTKQNQPFLQQAQFQQQPFPQKQISQNAYNKSNEEMLRNLQFKEFFEKYNDNNYSMASKEKMTERRNKDSGMNELDKILNLAKKKDLGNINIIVMINGNEKRENNTNAYFQFDNSNNNYLPPQTPIKINQHKMQSLGNFPINNKTENRKLRSYNNFYNNPDNSNQFENLFNTNSKNYGCPPLFHSNNSVGQSTLCSSMGEVSTSNSANMGKSFDSRIDLMDKEMKKLNFNDNNINFGLNPQNKKKNIENPFKIEYEKREQENSENKKRYTNERNQNIVGPGEEHIPNPFANDYFAK